MLTRWNASLSARRLCLAEPSFEIAIHTASDCYGWHFRHYAPPVNSLRRGRVVYLHGIQSHGGWYQHFCECVARVGFDVYFFERRGGGLNQQARGDTPRFQRFLDHIV